MNITTPIAIGMTALLMACTSTPPSQTGAAATTGATLQEPGSQADLVANVGDRVFFDFDKTSLTGGGSRGADNMAVLDRQAAWLAKYARNNVQIAGNCDERGTEEYNIALGQRRASVVDSYLVSKGVAAGRIATISYGKERPTALGSDEDSWSQNRNAITSVR